ncbi:hypothetical protein H0H93_016601 [Arthromyces matolae]|nr:hypothetical protein H0H93_016601 [Arthromyces matolae]
MDESSTATPHSDPRLLVATTLATLLLAGSAYVCCTGSRNIIKTFKGNEQIQASSKSKSNSKTLVTPSPVFSARSSHATDDDSEAKDNKATLSAGSSRPKERRKRGKDPLKDLFKNSKKNKALLGLGPGKQLAPVDTSSNACSKVDVDLSDLSGSRGTGCGDR